ncbi:CocE/NonD family hydrolase [Nocardioides astragali]|uniref:CocE/NonD family hydrolase n=2 Tax=Nocardioides astragali TaxID=1776736 RepID=A0ABW2N7I9_9ACTN
MRDGTVLRADVYRPSGDGPWPVIVVRTPYGKADPFENMFLEPLTAVKHGLIAVVQDVRARNASEGDDWVPLATEAQDGADTVAWAAHLDGSTGRVGMWGSSYMGNAQWQAASEQPEALGAIAPSITFRDGEGLTTRGGARELGLGRAWSVVAGFDVAVRRHAADEDAMMRAVRELVAAVDALPGATYDELPTGRTPLTDPVITRHRLPSFDVDSGDVSRRQEAVKVPALNIGGWFDIFLQGTIDNFVNGGPQDRLVIGPWNHMSFMPQQGELNFGAAASGGAVDLGPSLASSTFGWLHGHLSGDALPDEPPVRIYTMGANSWRHEDAWPLERAEPTKLFLQPDGRAGAAPVAGTSGVSYTYDPANPVPTLGGNTLLGHAPAGSFEQSRTESRDDVLVFTTEPLKDDVEVTGRISAELTVATDATTTDWVVRLCDVHPDGASYNVVDGITRVVTPPGKASVVMVDLWSTSMLFKKGHRMRVHVTSSSFPRWDRNLNTADGAETGEMRTARQTVHLGADSFVTLPVIRSGATT